LRRRPHGYQRNEARDFYRNRACESFFDIHDPDIQYPARRRTRRRRKLPVPLTVLLVLIIVLAVCVLGVSIYKLLGIQNANRSRDDYWAKVEGDVAAERKDGGSSDAVDVPDDPVFLGEADFSDHSFQWDYDRLLSLCSDAVGYIYQAGVMSYPIVQAQDNDKYLRSRLDGEYDIGGTIFVDARFEEGMEGQYSIVYGHNMYNSSMFGPLPDYEEESYYKEHPYFDIYIGYKHYRYYVFSAFVAEAEGYVYTYDLETGHFKEQFDRLRADGLYQTDVRELRDDDHVIILSTCVDFHDYTYRNVVCLVRGEEVIDR